MPMTKERTINCPTGCHEDYLEREAFTYYEANDQVSDYGTHYTCQRCEWSGTWSRQDGFVIEQEPTNPFDTDKYVW